MKWIEVVEFRSFNADDVLLELDVWKSLSDASGKAQIMKSEVYTHSTLPTDVSIHLFHESAQAANQGSPFGVRLVSELKAFGFVNHTVWIEKRRLQ